MTGRPAMDISGVLEEAQRRGFVGPGPLDPHLAHARACAAAVGDAPGRAVDLGSGGGLPGLVLAECWPTSDWLLVEAQQRRGAHLRWAVAELGLVDRVAVDQRRAEEAGRDPSLRATFDVVVSRSFGPPAVVAECAAPFLMVGGLLIVSEPPDGPDRWPPTGVEILGLGRDTKQVPGFMRLRQVEPVADRFPRRSGMPTKRPLF